MNFLNRRTTWSNAEFIVLKICIATAYLLIGAHFHQYINDYTIPVLTVFGITVVWAVSLWLNKMKSDT
jgi:hypothetical protein